MSDTSIDINNEMKFAGLPTTPAMLIELIDSCKSSEVRLARLSETGRQDAGLTSKVITIAHLTSYRHWD